MWVGDTILSGVSIGDNTVIGSGAVTKDVATNVVTVRNSCRIITQQKER